MKKLLQSILLLLLVPQLFAQVNVKVNLNVKHKMGEVETFDRQKFVNFHGTIEQNNWNTNNKLDDLIGDFLVDRDVHVGRNTGTISWAIKNNITQDAARPGYADITSIASNGTINRNGYAAKTWAHPYEYLDDQILCTQLHPFYPDGTTTNKGWAFSQTDTEDEPFGTASGEFLGRYVQEYYGTGGTTGQKKPAFLEITNEPLWDLVTVPEKNGEESEDLTRIFKFHSTVAQQAHKYNPDLQVGGYCAAFPDFDTDNFQRWNDRDKHFIDIAGADVDFWTIHLYDFPVIGGKAKYRKGSNVEATMDMLEQYSMMTLGHVKPLMISEYNAQTHDYNRDGWLPYRDWLKMKSTMSMMMQFMERADKINYAMPFFMLKAEWQIGTSTDPTNVHTSRMMRRENEPDAYTGDFVYTDKILMYDLLKDIKGTRVDTYSDDQDIMVDAYVDGSKAYVMINNLDFDAQTLNVDLSGFTTNATDIEVRHLYLNGRNDAASPVLDIQNYTTLPSFLEIGAEATYMLVFTYPSDVAIDELSEETKYYADSYLKEILSRQTLSFNIDDVALADYGEAVVRIGVSRDHGLSLSPNVKVNGTSLSIPSNFRGGPQTDRDNYFGVLEIPVPYELLKADNQIEVLFAGDGGHVSTVTMQVFNFSSDIRNAPARIASLSFAEDLLNLYPNPTTDNFTVSMKNVTLPYQLKLFNLQGQMLLHSDDNIGANNFDVRTLLQGLYVVEVVVNQQVAVQTLRVE